MMYKRFIFILSVSVVLNVQATRYPYAHQIADWMQEFFLLNQYFFSRDTARVLAGFAPLYIAARSVDHHMHRYAYESRSHVNK